MELSKKILAAMAAAALILTAGVFVSCGEDDDDDYGIITKDNSDNFWIDYTNDTSDTQRGYKTTTNAHSGALTQVTMNTVSNNAGAMGYIWDLESADEDGKYSRAAKDTRRFLIVGFNYKDGKVNPYVSQYKDVTDIQLNNFGATATNEKETGATATSNGAHEDEILALYAKDSSFAPVPDDDGNFVITLDVYEDGEWTWNTAKTKRNYTSYNGGYKVDIYNGAKTITEIADATESDKAVSTSVSADLLGYKAAAEAKLGSGETLNISKSIVAQQTCAVYANVYPGKTLRGSFKYANTYSEAEVIEE